jgi:Carboxypeptidase regulatory-like domain
MRLARALRAKNWPIWRRTGGRKMQERGFIRAPRRTVGKRKIPMFTFAAAFGLMLCCSLAVAQSGAGSIQGTVTDSTGAVISGASIHVANQDTGVKSDAKSNAAGLYQVPGLFTGNYVLTVTAPGMGSYQRTVDLLVGQNVVINPSLTLGAVTQKVDVNANAVQLVTTTSATLSSALENSRINQLPMNGRQIISLVGETTPGLTSHYGPGTIANGLLEDSSIEYEADGVPLLNRNFGGPNSMTQSQYPDPDTIQEVRTETSNSGAQFATPATAIISTKSGTNSLHGSLFETMRNNAVGIARNRSNLPSFAAPPLVRNEFGASAGGPIVIPHVYDGRNKSFWFFAYERYSQISTSYEAVTVPTMAMRNGDFSGLVNSAGVLQQLYDPATTAPSTNCNGTHVANQFCRAPFGNGIAGSPGDNQIPISRLSPTTKMLYDITPLPSNAQNPLVGSNLSVPNPSVFIVPTITFRVDHSFGENDKAYIRYTSNNQTNIALRNYPNNSPATLAADGIPAGASGFQSINDAQYAAALNYTHIFSPTFYSETTVSQQWFNQYVGGGGADASPNTNYESQLFKLPNNFGETGFPVICSSCLMPFGGTQYQYYEDQIVFNYDENLTKTIGRHQLHFGGRYRRERLSYLPSRQNDAASFDATGTSLENPTTGTAYSGTANTGETEADFFLGNASLYSVTLEPPQGHGHDMEFDVYFQDDWKVTKNLTLNFGLRNTYLPGLWTKDGLGTTFDFKNNAFVMSNPTSYYVSHGYTTQAIITNLQNIGVTFETSAQAGFPSSNMQNKNELEPRVGFAWQPFSGKYGIVLRGGYGKYVFPTALRSSWQQMFAGFPYVQNYTQNYNLASQSPDGMSNYLVRNPQSVVMGVNDGNVVNTSTTNAIVPGFSIIALSPNYPPDVAQETSLTIEQPLKGNSALRVSWVFTHGSDLDQTYAVNQPLSPFVWEMSTGTPVPTGGASTIGTSQYAATALNPYNNVTYGGMSYYGKTGYSNDNALQVNYQRLFHHGIAYQVIYVWQKAFTGDGTVYTPQDYLGTRGTAPNTTFAPLVGGSAITPGATPPSSPAGTPSWETWRGLTNFETYEVNAGNPKQEVEFNGIIDLPFGKGKRFLGNAHGFLNQLVGGFQLAGDGSIVGQYFQPISSHWGPTNPIKVYKHGLPIKDCRSGVCLDSYEWFNGYLAPTVLPAPLGTCTSKCVEGLPSDWVPFATPINNTPGTPNYGNDNVQVSSPALLASNKGNPVTVAYSPGQSGNNPFSKTIIPGPINWSADLSLFKVFPITETVNFRVNLDAFNVFNVQGYNNPSTTDGTELVQPGGVGASSHNTPRQLQLTARLTF